VAAAILFALRGRWLPVGSGGGGGGSH
jgi:hypothetical protein